jgi:hypothetical protein
MKKFWEPHDDGFQVKGAPVCAECDAVSHNDCRMSHDQCPRIVDFVLLRESQTIKQRASYSEARQMRGEGQRLHTANRDGLYQSWDPVSPRRASRFLQIIAVFVKHSKLSRACSLSLSMCERWDITKRAPILMSDIPDRCPLKISPI